MDISTGGIIAVGYVQMYTFFVVMFSQFESRYLQHVYKNQWDIGLFDL